MAGGGAEGQAEIAGAVKTAGFIAALTAPALGLMIDRGGTAKADHGLDARRDWLEWTSHVAGSARSSGTGS